MKRLIILKPIYITFFFLLLVNAGFAQTIPMRQFVFGAICTR